MGAWGYKVLQNDIALDLMGTLSKLSTSNSETHSVIKTYLNGAEYTEELLLAAEIVDIALNGMDEKILGSTYGYDKWFESIHENGRLFNDLRECAVKAVRGIDVAKEGWFSSYDATSRTKLLKKIEKRLLGEVATVKPKIKRVYNEDKKWIFGKNDNLIIKVGDKVHIKLDLKKNLKRGSKTDLKQWGYLNDDGYIDIDVRDLSKGYLFGYPIGENYDGTGVPIELYPRNISSIRKLKDDNEVFPNANSIKYVEHKYWTVTNANGSIYEITNGDKILVTFQFDKDVVSEDFLNEHTDGMVELKIISIMNTKIKGHVLDCKDPCTYLELYPKNIIHITKL